MNVKHFSQQSLRLDHCRHALIFSDGQETPAENVAPEKFITIKEAANHKNNRQIRFSEWLRKTDD